ncbi:PREDICTED: ubiquitin-protein ligase E3A-like, partial [Amphimedon queenslandica]|uniref:HECT-type E3 ubiquitin transferase n=1 Tax=Amphimedon queenslandica TaxID=400682 RepID=A0AAN0IJC6_AMPQE
FQEYVDLYTDWLLNKSIAKQFDAFKKGFDLVMKDKHLADLFTAEEVEMLVCGSKEWDFNSLEENTRYDGFSKSHSVIINFWEVFYEFNEDEKKQLLAFVTGSDRVPVGGLSNLKLVIVKNGPDSDRLPTAHTCFNALLLCEYSSKEKLKERLLTAIRNGKGFGML